MRNYLIKIDELKEIIFKVTTMQIAYDKACELISEICEKRALNIPVVSSSLPNESELTAEEETRKEKFEHDLRWEENRGNDF